MCVCGRCDAPVPFGALSSITHAVCKPLGELRMKFELKY